MNSFTRPTTSSSSYSSGSQTPIKPVRLSMRPGTAVPTSQTAAPSPRQSKSSYFNDQYYDSSSRQQFSGYSHQSKSTGAAPLNRTQSMNIPTSNRVPQTPRMTPMAGTPRMPYQQPERASTSYGQTQQTWQSATPRAQSRSSYQGGEFYSLGVLIVHIMQVISLTRNDHYQLPCFMIIKSTSNLGSLLKSESLDNGGVDHN